MIETLNFLAAPFCLVVFLVAIHAYLGLHVLEREVIFVDISLAQVAALGGAVNLLFAQSNESWHGFVWALAFCLLAALILAALRRSEKKLSQEVLIGITYAFASGCLILVMDRLPHGAEYLKEAMIGNILFVTWPMVLLTGLVYLAVGCVHLIFRRQFWASTRGQETSFLWDFLFYFLFGVVITFSTRHAGVLVVFSILVVPAALSTRMVFGELKRLLTAWFLGLVGITLAFFLSYKYDFPAGAGIVFTLTTGFFILLVAYGIYEKATSGKAS